tara:strand:+ start:2092 stop:2337 length:246 start_codon:yes stop_codon:yes gene_type:complete
MNYTLNQLNIFQKVVEHKSVSRASVALHLTQTAVSIQLKNFQQNFSIPLTEIVGRQFMSQNLVVIFTKLISLFNSMALSIN